MNLDVIVVGFEQGLVLALVAYAVMIPFRLLDLPDLSVEGSFPLGGAVGACFLASGFPVGVSLLAGAMCGSILGMLTGMVTQCLRINSLLAGIILSTMAYSVNLRILGKPNLSLFHCSKIFDYLGGGHSITILILALMLLCVLLPFVYFLYTYEGLRFRSIGLNLRFAYRQSIPVVLYTVLGFLFAGFLSGLSGALMVQLQGYMDIGMGVGMVIHGLAALMVGEVVCQSSKSLLRQVIAPLVGAVLYQQIQGCALTLGLMPSDLKFFTGGLVLAILVFSRYGRKEGCSGVF